MIEAKIIADSLGPFGDRIITYVLTFPRIVLAEFNTHRALSRNSASSRAIPFKKMLKMVEENPFIPIRWMKEHTGMQGNEYFEDEKTINFLKYHWITARDKAIYHANTMNVNGLTKQVCNRLLEPFMWHTCICTATEWENFFALRANPEAEIHIQELAHKMLEAANVSIPRKLKEGEWHIPFGDTFDEKRIEDVIYQEYAEDWVLSREKFIQKYKVMIATARCARVSYLNFEGKDDYVTDITLYKRLLASGHMSPFEHCAYALADNQYNAALCDTKFMGGDDYGNAIYEYGWDGNFRGFRQLRKTLPNENKKDERFIRMGS